MRLLSFSSLIFQVILFRTLCSAFSWMAAKANSEIALPLDCDKNQQANRASKFAATTSRRDFAALVLSSTWLVATGGSSAAVADITDETELYANSSPDSAYSTLKNAIPSTSSNRNTASSSTRSDELSFTFFPEELNEKSLGIELKDVSFQSNLRVYVKSVQKDSLAEQKGIQPDFIVVSVNGVSAERTNAAGVVILVQQAMKRDQALELVLRDPSFFTQTLKSNNWQSSSSITTQIAPESISTTTGPQSLTVTQLIPPSNNSGMCTGAQVGDLLEISYTGSVVRNDDTTVLFDGSTVNINGKGSVPGRGGDVSLFFVLGKQPSGQFPPGWDIGLQGMCVSERRRLILPPVLAYGSKGLPRRGIPPNATLQYDITLISINGIATPQ